MKIVPLVCTLVRTLVLGGGLGLGLACHTKPAQLESRPGVGSFGLDLAGMDPAVRPGDDFYLYANGKWMERTVIPPDRSRVASFSTLDDVAQARTRTILEEAAGDARARGDRKKVGDFYAAFLDESAIEARGLDPVRPALATVAAIGDAHALARVLGQGLRADVDLLNATDWYTDRIFGLWVSQDLERPGQYAPYLVQGGLGLPDPSFYRDPERIEPYRAHAAKVLALAGIPAAEAAAGRILALETAIAGVHASAEETADVKKGDNPWRREEFGTRAPGLDWAAFFEGAGLGQQDRFVVWQPEAVRGIAGLVASQPLATWKEYLTLRVLERAESLLPKTFADEGFAFHGTVLSGTTAQQPRWRRAITAVNAAMGEAVGKLYVERHFSAATKARAEEMVANLLAAFRKRIEALEWMAPTTKGHALAKLDGMRIAVGYPERWHDFSGLEVRRDDALGNAERAEELAYRQSIAKLGRAVDHDEWAMLPQEVNALNLPLENRLIFPAAILEPPFFDGAADDAVNYGAIGTVIGHEISHSFDSSGALVDENGLLANWWTPEDLAHFESASSALAAQFSAYRPLPDVPVNGNLTLGENIADVAGLATAFDAYEASHRAHPAPTLAGFTPEQRLFLSFAQIWRSKAREPVLRTLLLTNVHAPGQCRALTVRNQDGWYAAFGVQPGTALYLPPGERVKVW